MVEAEAVFGNKTPHFICTYSDGFIIYHTNSSTTWLPLSAFLKQTIGRITMGNSSKCLENFSPVSNDRLQFQKQNVH